MSKLNGKNKIKAINSWDEAIMKYGAGVLEWRFDELKDCDRKTQKLLRTHERLHPKSNVDRLSLAEEREEEDW